MILLVATLLSFWLHRSFLPKSQAPEEYEVLIDSVPSGAEVHSKMKPKMDALRMGEESFGKISATLLGRTPFRTKLQKVAGKPVASVFTLRLDGFNDQELTVMERGDGFYRVWLQPRFPAVLWEYPKKLGRESPWLALTYLWVLLALTSFALQARWKLKYAVRQEAAAEEPRPGTFLGDFKLLSALGQGGAGRVFRALDLNNGEEVALKILLKNDAESQEALETEIKALKRLHHVNIVHVLDWGYLANRYYLVMELVQGRALSLAWRGPRPWSEVKPVILAVASALIYLQEHDLVHRDLKADNLVLTESGVVKLVDFGIASMDGHRSQTLRGTPLTMSPEHAAGGAPVWQSDVYALGLLAYQGLTGTLPFSDSEHALEQLLRKTQEDAPPLPEGCAPAEARELIMRMLRRVPEERFAHKADFAEAVAALSRDQAT